MLLRVQFNNRINNCNKLQIIFVERPLPLQNLIQVRNFSGQFAFLVRIVPKVMQKNFYSPNEGRMINARRLQGTIFIVQLIMDEFILVLRRSKKRFVFRKRGTWK